MREKRRASSAADRGDRPCGKAAFKTCLVLNGLSAAGFAGFVNCWNGGFAYQTLGPEVSFFLGMTVLSLSVLLSLGAIVVGGRSWARAGSRRRLAIAGTLVSIVVFMPSAGAACYVAECFYRLSQKSLS